MDHYHIWVNLKNTHQDLEFTDHVRQYLGHLKSQGLIEGFGVARRKLGFGPQTLGEFHIVIDVSGLDQLERAFGTVARREGVVEDFHKAVYSRVTDFTSALYRDFPDPQRVPRTELKARRP